MVQKPLLCKITSYCLGTIIVCWVEWKLCSLVAAEMENMLWCACISGAACHRVSCPGHSGIHTGGGRCCPWWLIMWPSSFSPPLPEGRAEIGMFSASLLLDFLYSEMFFIPHTDSHSSAAACPRSSPYNCFFFLFLAPLIFLFCSFCASLRSSLSPT